MKTYKVTEDEYGATHWYNEDGELHREDGPAIEWASGTKLWCINGQHHREDGPAVELASGTKQWWINGQLHREDGPAYEGADGYKSWWLNGEYHREDGPAIEWADGQKAWFINGQPLTKKEFNQRTQPHKEMTIAQLEKVLGHKIKIVKE